MSRPASTRPAAGGRRPSALAPPHLSLLNGFGVRFGECDILLPPGAQRLLVFLALHDRVQLRVRVACSLWLDVPEERAFGNLRSTLWRVNRLGRTLVEATPSRLRLAPDVVVDLEDATAHARRLLDPSPLDDLEQLVASLLDAELLPDWYDEWVIFERERFRQLRLHALEAACDRLVMGRRFGSALAAGLAAVAAEPLRESAHRALIRAHLAEGNVNEAIRQYRMCRRLLSESLGIGPSAELQELVRGLDIPVTAR